jgi:hypothetical protein
MDRRHLYAPRPKNANSHGGEVRVHPASPPDIVAVSEAIEIASGSHQMGSRSPIRKAPFRFSVTSS